MGMGLRSLIQIDQVTNRWRMRELHAKQKETEMIESGLYNVGVESFQLNEDSCSLINLCRARKPSRSVLMS